MTVLDAMAYLLRELAHYGYYGAITSGTRSWTEQARLYALRQAGRIAYPVAPPGRSKHNTGMAVDVTASPSTLAIIGQVWESWGGTWGGRWRGAQYDPVHYEF